MKIFNNLIKINKLKYLRVSKQGKTNVIIYSFNGEVRRHGHKINGPKIDKKYFIYDNLVSMNVGRLVI